MKSIQWRLRVLRSAEHEIDELPEAAYEEALNVIADLTDDPRPPGSLLLRNYRDVYRIRIGNGRYRIVYRVSQHQRLIVIWRIGPRAMAYTGL